MKTSEFLAHLKRLNVKVWAANGELKCSAPKGVLTAELREELGRHKSEILALVGGTGDGSAEAGPGAARIPRVPRRPGMPLSFTQQRLWFLQQLEPELAAYNIGITVGLLGPLDVRALERSLTEIVRRHEALRTTFPEVGGRPTQLVGEPYEIRLGVIQKPDGPSEQEWREENKRRMVEWIVELFDLRKGPLFRPVLIQIGEREHVLFVSVHHIVFDGMSLGVFLRELCALYDAFTKDRPSPLSEPPVQYADFAAWQQEYFRGREYERLVDFWKSALAGKLPILELPTDRPRPPIQTFHGAHKERLLPRALIASLEELSRREGATLYMVLLAAYKVLLSRYTGLDDIIVGTAINNRNHPEVEHLIGFFANTLVLRTSLAGDPTIRELIARVKETCLGAFEHQDMPFERLVDELSPERNLAYSPIFQTLFLTENVPNAPQRMGEITFQPFGLDVTMARNDLTLWAALDRERFFAWAEYNTDLFDPETVDALLDHYVEVLQSGLSNPDARVSRLEMTARAERERLLEEWNATEAEYPQSALHEQVERRVDANPEGVALIYPHVDGTEDEELSYRELDERANQLAHHLAKRGIGPGDLVGVCLERSSWMVETVLGILKVGAAYVPLDPSFPSERLAYMAQDSGAKLVVSRSEHDALFESSGVEVLELDQAREAIAGEPRTRLGVKVDPSSRMYVIYTSGSTGRPKGVEIQHRSVANFLASMQRQPGFVEGEKLLAVTTLSFDISVLELMLPLVSGGVVVVAPKEAVGDARHLAELLSRFEVDVMQATPATWRLLLVSGWEGSSRLRILSGGEALPRELAQELLVRGRELWNLYGPTETTIWSTVKQVEDGKSAVTIGRPIANTRIYVLDKNLELCPIGVPGELWIGGEGLARGYLNRSELTAERFLADPFAVGGRMYRTGDLAKWKRDGDVECLGRVDNQVKLRGFRIELGEIESVLSEVDGVKQCVCVVKEEGAGDQRLVAYFTRKEGARPQEALVEALRGKARERLPSYMAPSLFAELAELPLTPNGKVDRKALKERELSGSYGGESALVSAETELEQRIAQVWGEVLKLGQVSVTRNFFDLGGHSLLLAEAHAKLRETLDPQLSIIEMFQFPTVRALAAHIGARGGRKEADLAPERRASLAAGRKALMQRRRR